MPQLGESVTEGTVTRWLKKEGDRVEADEPLLEVSTDKVDTEIPSPASGTLQSIKVAEDETVEVGAELALIGEGAAPAAPAESAPAAEPAAEPAAPAQPEPAAQPDGNNWEAAPEAPAAPEQPAPEQPAPTGTSPDAQPDGNNWEARPDGNNWEARPDGNNWEARPNGNNWEAAPEAPAPAQPAAPAPAPDGASAGAVSPAGNNWEAAPEAPGGEGPYVTPLVRKLAAEHNVDLGSLTGTGVGGRVRKQDVLEAARVQREQAQAAPPAPAAQPAAAAAPSAPAEAAAPAAAPAKPRPVEVDTTLRGKTVKMTRLRQLVASRMVESLQSAAQLTQVVEVDVTKIARLRDRAKAEFLAREGTKLSFLPFFALATVEALKQHPKLNSSMDEEKKEVTYYDAEHLAVAVDTERGLVSPVIKDAGDLNLGGLARKIADLASRTRANKVSPDELYGGTFTLTNTGSVGALFDTPILNRPQVGILGAGLVVKRPVVVDDAQLGEVIAVRSMVYLSLTYDHRLVDGADAARFLQTIKARLEEGAFEADLGLV
jgi:2-oxoglutarate dehydrogenase E2 component (dihydrolipoamide succinyltransferase)